MSLFRVLRGRPISRSLHRHHRASLETLETRVVLSGSGAILDVSTAPFYLRAQVASPSPTPLSPPYLGGSLAATPDGDLLVFSTSLSEGSVRNHANSLEVWTRASHEWNRQAIIPPPDDAPAREVGQQLVVSADGSTIAASTVTNADLGTYELLIYAQDAGSWSLQQSISIPHVMSVAPFPKQYTRLTISDDGGVIALASPIGTFVDPNHPTGVVRVFTRSDETWVQTAELTSPDVDATTMFGSSIDLSADGSTLAVGAALEFGRDAGPGNVYLYRASDSGGWDAPIAVESAPFGWFFGEVVSLSANGRTLLLSGVEPSQESPYTYPAQGTAHIYEETPSGWVRAASFAESDPHTSAFYGRQLGLSPDGRTAVVAGVDFPDGTWKAYIYDRDQNWERIAVVTTDRAQQPYGSHGDLTVSNNDVFLRAPLQNESTIDVYHRSTSLDVLLDPVAATTTPSVAATFTTAAAGAREIHVQWQKSRDQGQSWTDIAGATFDWYTVVPTLADSGTMFRARFTDGDGATATTRPADLLVEKATAEITVVTTLEQRTQSYIGTFDIQVAPNGITPHIPSGGTIRLEYTDSSGSARTYSTTVRDGVASIQRRSSLGLLPGVHEIVAIYDGSTDPVFRDAETRFYVTIPQDQPSFQATLSLDEPYHGQETILRIRLTEGQEPTGMIAVWSGWSRQTFVTAVPLAGTPDRQWGVDVPLHFEGGGVRHVVWEYLGDHWNQAVEGRISFQMSPTPTTILVTPRSGSFIHDYRQPEPIIYDVEVQTIDGRPATGWVTSWHPDDPSMPTRHVQTDSAGRVSFNLNPNMSVGAHEVNFAFQESTAFAAATKVVGVGVYKSETTTVLTALTPAVPEGTPAEFVVKVAQQDSLNFLQDGTEVTIYVDGVHYRTVRLNSGGNATFSINLSAAGVRTVVALYRETQNYQASLSNIVTMTTTTAATATVLTSSRNPALENEMLAFHADVAAAENSRPTTGAVRFYLGLTPIAEVQLDANSRATLPARFSVADYYLITAVYLGVPGFQPSLSNRVLQEIHRIVPVPLAASSPIPEPAAETETPPSPPPAPSASPRAARAAAWVAMRNARLAKLVQPPQRRIPLALRGR